LALFACSMKIDILFASSLQHTAAVKYFHFELTTCAVSKL
jgi:hypothetical protein